jgi:serine/threonine protein kinase
MFSNTFRGILSDKWSVGIIAYYLAAQQLPFNPKDPHILKQLILYSEPQWIPNSFTTNFRSFFMATLNKNPLYHSTAHNLLISFHRDFSHASQIISPIER